MALKFSDIPFRGALCKELYSRVITRERDKALKQQILLVKTFGSERYALSNPRDALMNEVIVVLEKDFDQYFADEILRKEGVTLESQAYKFLKSINTSNEECPYKCIINYSEGENV